MVVEQEVIPEAQPVHLLFRRQIILGGNGRIVGSRIEQQSAVHIAQELLPMEIHADAVQQIVEQRIELIDIFLCDVLLMVERAVELILRAARRHEELPIFVDRRACILQVDEFISIFIFLVIADIEIFHDVKALLDICLRQVKIGLRLCQSIENLLIIVDCQRCEGIEMHLLDIGDEHTDNGPDSLESPIVCTMPSVLAQILLQEVLCEYRFRIDVVFIKVLYECIDIVHAVVPQSSNQLSI